MAKPMPLKYKDELDYAVEVFVDENDRQPTEVELVTIKDETQTKIDEAQEVYDEFIASGAFECAVCDKIHHHWAPKPCRDAYNSGEF